MKYVLSVATSFVLILVPSISAKAKPVSADVRWTEYGIPHVTAESFQGLGFGYGYAVARDRLCVLADRAITLRGERSRWHGAEGEAVVGFVPTKNLESDLFHKIQLSDEVARKAEAKLSRDALSLSSGYADGINKYVKTFSPAQLRNKCANTAVPHFKRSDVIRSMLAIGTIWKAMRVAPYATASDWGGAPAQAQIALKTGQSVPPGIGSNAWAYGGNVSSTGSAILMANPHTSWNGNDWLLMHQMHLTIPGVIDVAGADFVGVPMPVTGFNNHVAWTIEAPLTVKYYVLQKMAISSENATYDFGGKPVALAFKRTAIAVRSSDGRIATRNFRIPFSNLGPLYQLPESEGQPAGWYAISDAGDSNANGLDQLIAMARARDAKEFVAAVESNRGIGAHMIAADKNGLAIYTEAGPLLAASDDRLEACRLGTDHSPDILDGSRAACSFRDTGGRLSLAGLRDIPSFTTPGIVHNLNNSYHKSVYQNPATGYSSLLGNADEHDLRLDMSEKRLAELLGSGKISPETAVSLALDNRNFAAEQWLDRILDACLPTADKRILQGCKVLKNWDRRNDASSRGPAFFSEIWSRMSETDAYEDVTSGSVTLSAKTALKVRNVIVEATARMDSLGIPLDRQWGDLMVRNTAKGRVTLHGGSGNEGVLNVLEGEEFGKEGYANISNGTSYLQLVYWDNGTVKAKTLLAQGQSSDLNSPHYDDQLGHYVRKELVPFPFRKSDVASATIEQITIDQ